MNNFEVVISPEIRARIIEIVPVLVAQGFRRSQQAATLGNIGKECAFQLREENLDYSHTANSRIREIFGAARTSMSDAELDAIKQEPQDFAERMYGRGTQTGIGLGNVQPGDGWLFRGRGYIQITGRTNYKLASVGIFQDTRLILNPGLLIDPLTAAKVTAWYLGQRLRHPSIARSLGIDPLSDAQPDVNLICTSAVAGMPITRGVGYLGTECIQKVDAWAAAVMEFCV